MLFAMSLFSRHAFIFAIIGFSLISRFIAISRAQTPPADAAILRHVTFFDISSIDDEIDYADAAAAASKRR